MIAHRGFLRRRHRYAFTHVGQSVAMWFASAVARGGIGTSRTSALVNVITSPHAARLQKIVANTRRFGRRDQFSTTCLTGRSIRLKMRFDPEPSDQWNRAERRFDAGDVVRAGDGAADFQGVAA